MKSFRMMILFLSGAVVVFAMSLVGITTAEAIEMKLGHMRPVGSSIHNSAVYFAKEVEKKTNGRIKITIFGANQLGDYETVLQRVGMGDVEMFLGSIGTAVDKSLQVVTCPYLVSTWSEVREHYNTNDGIMAEFVKKRYDKQNIKLLAIHPMYFGSIALAKKPKDPKNPYVPKGLKVRVPASKSFNEMGKTLGYITTPLPSSENFTSMQTGIVDGVIGGGSEYYWGQLKDLTKYIILCNTHLENHWLSINKDVWEDISSKDQEIILSIAKKVEENAFRTAIKEETKYDELFQKAGITVYKLSDKELAVYANKVRTEVWPKIENIFGSEGRQVFELMKKKLGLTK